MLVSFSWAGFDTWIIVVLLTGATGALGCHVVELLVDFAVKLGVSEIRPFDIVPYASLCPQAEKVIRNKVTS